MTVLALATATCCLSAHAQSSAAGISFSGFGTVGIARSNTDLAEFNVPGQIEGASKSSSASVDTKLGLQANAKLDNMISATGQVLTKLNGEGNWQPAVEWLFAKAKFTPELSLRAGRIGLPAFAVSDFRDVNYANTWMRPPIDVYGQVAVSHLDGADLNWQWVLGDATINTQLFAGKSSSVYTQSKIKLDNVVGFNTTVELDGGWTLRLGHVRTKLTVENPALGGLLTTLAATPFASVGEQIDPTKKAATFTGLGLTYDDGPWVISGEYTRRKTESYVSDTTGWYGSMGYRMGKFTPYVVLSSLKVDDSNVVNTVPKGVSAPLDGLSAAVDGVVATQALGQKTTSLGVRWDAYRNTAFKLQYDRIRTDGGRGLFSNVQPGFANSGAVNVYAASVDFVF